MSYRRVTYASVLQKVSSLYSGQLVPSTADANRINVFINQRAGEMWEHYYWPELTPSEKRQFRSNWADAPTSYSAPTATVAVEVYWPAEKKYYQNLRAANSGNAPADADGVENSAWWAECASEYSAEDWLTGTVYAVGQKVLNPSDQRYYQCHTAHTAGATFDATKFGILTPFVRDIDYAATGQTAIGHMKAVWDHDPYVYEYYERNQIAFDLTDTGCVVRGTDPVVYCEFRLTVPSWTGSNYSATTTYALTGQCYDPTTGDFYTSAQAANTGHAVTDTAWWTRIDFPYVLRDAVAQAVWSDMLRITQRYDQATVEEARALALRDNEIRAIELKQSQSKALNVPWRANATL